MYVCMYVCMHVCMCIYIYIHIGADLWADRGGGVDAGLQPRVYVYTCIDISIYIYI